MPTPTRFVLLFEGRTGSSYLISCLASLPHICADGEILLHLDDAAQRAIVHDFYHADRGPHVQAVGFKTKLRDITSPDVFKEKIESLGVRVIHMIRDNKVKLAVSRLNGQRLKAQGAGWNRTAKVPPLPPFAPTIEDFDAALRHRTSKDLPLDAFVATLRLPLMTLRYEELLADQAAAFARVFDFIGAAPGPVSSPVVKNTDDDLRKVLLNYEEIRRHYAGTEYEPMFD